MSAADWVVSKIDSQSGVEVVDRIDDDFLVIRARDGYEFLVAVLGVKGSIELANVQPLFASSRKPQLVVNVPSEVTWRGEAIDYIHAASAAFGTMGDIARAARTKDAGAYRNKNMKFFIDAMQQHSNVLSVSYIRQDFFRVTREKGESLSVAVVEAYNMSAEDVRNARAQLGHFDIVVKSSSYGSITHQAEAAAASMGSQALDASGLMKRLGR